MRAILFSVFIICVVQLTSFSQPAFTSYGEIKVSQSSVDDSPPSIAVNYDGAVWVVWGKGSQWFYPNLNRDGTESKFVGSNAMSLRDVIGLRLVINNG